MHTDYEFLKATERLTSMNLDNTTAHLNASGNAPIRLVKAIRGYFLLQRPPSSQPNSISMEVSDLPANALSMRAMDIGAGEESDSEDEEGAMAVGLLMAIVRMEHEIEQAGEEESTNRGLNAQLQELRERLRRLQEGSDSE